MIFPVFATVSRNTTNDVKEQRRCPCHSERWRLMQSAFRRPNSKRGTHEEPWRREAIQMRDFFRARRRTARCLRVDLGRHAGREYSSPAEIEDEAGEVRKRPLPRTCKHPSRRWITQRTRPEILVGQNPVFEIARGVPRASSRRLHALCSSSMSNEAIAASRATRLNAAPPRDWMDGGKYSGGTATSIN